MPANPTVQTAKARSGERRDWSRYIFSTKMAWIVFGISVGLTGLAWMSSVRYLNQRAEVRFDAQVARIELAIKERMHQYARLLTGGAGFYNGSSHVSRNDWYAYITALKLEENYPGTQGIGVAKPVPPEFLDDFRDLSRTTDFEDFDVYPKGDREFYAPVTFVEPLDWRNRHSLGFDLYSDTSRRLAIDYAIATGEVAISSMLALRPDHNAEPEIESGFLMVLPVFHKSVVPGVTLDERRRNLRSMVFGLLRAKDLLQNVLGGLSDEVSLRLFDELKEETELLYASPNVNNELDEPRFSVTKVIPIFGHYWLMDVRSKTSKASRNDRWQSAIIGFGGLLVDIMLFALINLGGKRGRALEREVYTRKLERSNDDLERFAHAAAHDLKSPLRAIDNLSAWIEKDNEAILPEESKRHLALLRARSKRLERLLDDLLAYSRIDLAHQVLEVVSMEDLVGEIVDLLSIPGAFEINITRPMPVLRTNRAPLRQVLLNLVSNSMKHHDGDNGRVCIASEWKDGHLECTVTDNGPGVAPEHRERVFEMFATLQRKDTRDTSGVGLAMVAKMVDNHGGVISMESGDEGERGLRVRFTWSAELVETAQSEGRGEAETRLATLA